MDRSLRDTLWEKMPKTFQHSWGPQPIDLIVDAIVENKEIKRVVVKGEL